MPKVKQKVMYIWQVLGVKAQFIDKVPVFLSHRFFLQASIRHRERMEERVLLYVEDEDAAVFLFETALKEAGIQLQLYRVSDGEQALAFLRHDGAYEKAPKPDMVLLDLNLPRKNGLDVLAEIHASEDLKRIPTVVFTSSSLASDRRRSISLGAQEYITKPSTFEGFIKAVKAACSHLPDAVGQSGGV